MVKRIYGQLSFSCSQKANYMLTNIKYFDFDINLTAKMLPS